MIVLRTFSKAYGLAGARTGYGIVSNDIAEDSIFTKWNLPYDSNNIGAILAPLVLEDQEHMQFVREETNRLRTQIEDAINSNSNLRYVRGSVTNTLIAKCKNPKFKLVTELANNGMVVCDQDRYMGTGGKGYSRITVGRENEVKTLCDALREFRG